MTGKESGVSYTWTLRQSGLASAHPTPSYSKVAITTSADTPSVIASFMQNRANHMLSNQPNIGGFLNGTSSGGGRLGNLALNGTKSNLTLAFSTSLSQMRSRSQQRSARNFTTTANDQTILTRASSKTVNPALAAPEQDYPGQDNRDLRYDIWAEVYGANTKSGSAKSKFWIGYLGAHYFISSDLLVGGLVQADWTDESNTTAGSSARGNGWMVGPYIAGLIPNQNVFYEARVAWGKSDNKVSPLGTYTDSFKTERWLASAKISGIIAGDRYTVIPSASVSWFEETQESYTDSLANLIPSQTISMGEVRFGPSVRRSFTLAGSTVITPSVGISGVWNFGINKAAAQGFALGNNDLRARVDVGLSAARSNGLDLDLAGYYDGLGISDYESWGASVRLNFQW